MDPLWRLLADVPLVAEKMDYWQCKIIPKNELKRWRSVDLNRVWKLLGLLWRCMAEICCKLLVALQLVFRVLPLLSSPCYLLLSNICADFQIVLL